MVSRAGTGIVMAAAPGVVRRAARAGAGVVAGAVAGAAGVVAGRRPGGASWGGGMRGRVPSSRPIYTWADSRSMLPPAPDAFSARAIALIRAIAAVACTAGSRCPASVAVAS